MGLAPATSLLFLLLAATGVVALDGTQVGNVALGIDIRIPLDAFQCDPWLVYYKISPTDQGRAQGVDYNAQTLLLTTVDDARTPIVTMNLPQGEGVISWQMNLKHDSQFFVAPHGLITQGDYVEVKSGGGGDACLTLPTQTTRSPYVTYNGPAFNSQQAHHYTTNTRFFNQRTTSPAAGLQTHFVQEGVLVTPTPTPTPTPVPSPTSTKPTNTSTNNNNNTPTPNATSSQSHESSGSQTSSVPTATITSAPSTSSSPSGTDTVSAPPQSSSDSSSVSGEPVAGSGTSPAQNPGAQTAGDANAPRSHSHTAAIAAGIAVGVLLILLGILCFFLIRRRRQRERGERLIPYTHDSGMTEAATIGSIAPIYEPQPRVGKGLGPTARYFHDDASQAAPETAMSTASSEEESMDLARALAVVAAHVRQAENIDPTGAPPEYSRAPVGSTHIAGSSSLPSTNIHRKDTYMSTTPESSDWMR